MVHFVSLTSPDHVTWCLASIAPLAMNIRNCHGRFTSSCSSSDRLETVCKYQLHGGPVSANSLQVSVARGTCSFVRSDKPGLLLEGSVVLFCGNPAIETFKGKRYFTLKLPFFLSVLGRTLTHNFKFFMKKGGGPGGVCVFFFVVGRKKRNLYLKK